MSEESVTIAEEIHRQGADGDVVALIKAHVIGVGDQVPGGNVQQPTGENISGIVHSMNELEWPYDPRLLCNLFELSSALRPNIDAYVTNIDAFGHTFEPKIDLSADDANQVISNAMFLDRAHLHERDSNAPAPKLPSEAEVFAKIEEIRMTMLIELGTLKSFYNSCCVGIDFVKLRRKTRQDIEVLGNGFWEAIRNAEDRLVLFNYVPAFSIRLGRLGRVVEVPVRVESSDISFEEVQVRMRFRPFIQNLTPNQGGRRTWFKEFGDPRIMSNRTGNLYETVEDLKFTEESASPATELLHFSVDSPRTPYGIPRWIGALLAVMGTRQAEEVNFLYFDNKSIPPLAILVSGGRMAPQATEKIRTYMDEEIKGKRNFHKILILEAEPAGKHQDGVGRVKIEIRPLTQAIQSDALFQKYDERNADKVGQQFRLPRMLRGDIRDFNKSTAFAALMFADQQVFGPEREDFDTDQNRKIFPDLGIKFWRYRSRAPVTRDPQTLSTMVRDLVRGGILVPNEGRQIAADIFNREFSKIEDKWATQPIQLTLAEINVAAKGIIADETVTPAAKRLLPIAKLFVDLHEQLDGAESDTAFAVAKQEAEIEEQPIQSISVSKSDPSQIVADVKNEAGDIITIRVPQEKMLEWVIPHSE